jgi:hypothetical protein
MAWRPSPYDFEMSGGDLTPPPGWYPDPAQATRLRWWNGGTWTGYVAARPFDGSGGGGPPTLAEEPTRRWSALRVLQIAAALTVLVAPLNAVILSAAQTASQDKQSCSAPLPWYHTLPSFSVPALFGLVAGVCLLIGIDTVVQGRRQWSRSRQDAGTLVVVLSVVGVAVAGVSLFFAVIVVGFSTWCF